MRPADESALIWTRANVSWNTEDIRFMQLGDATFGCSSAECKTNDFFKLKNHATYEVPDERNDH